MMIIQVSDTFFHDLEKEKKEIYNQAIDDALNVVEWDGYTLDIKERIEQLKR